MPGIFLRLTLIGSTRYNFTIAVRRTICRKYIMTEEESYYADSGTK